jgi:hypothetical protein
MCQSSRSTEVSHPAWFQGDDMTFEEVYAVTNRLVPDVRTFSEAECRRYFDLLMALPPQSAVVEIGLQFGRSSSIVAQVAKELDLFHFGIDPFIDPPDAYEAWSNLMRSFGHRVICNRFPSTTEGIIFPSSVKLALIDGDHWEAGVLNDIRLMAPVINPGGRMLFHDYGINLPNVYPSVNPGLVRANMPDGWIEEDRTDTLGVWRKL